MSEEPQADPPGPAPGRNPWVTALLILIGIILLLPGLCTLILFRIQINSGGSSPGNDPNFLPLLIPCLLVGAGGVALIVFAILRKR